VLAQEGKPTYVRGKREKKKKTYYFQDHQDKNPKPAWEQQLVSQPGTSSSPGQAKPARTLAPLGVYAQDSTKPDVLPISRLRRCDHLDSP